MPKGDKLYISMAVPFPDSSGSPILLGAYASRLAAEARCWRFSRHSEQPTQVWETALGVDLATEAEPHPLPARAPDEKVRDK